MTALSYDLDNFHLHDNIKHIINFDYILNINFKNLIQN